jgi:pantetheine-phosphate adenylyltransferase
MMMKTCVYPGTFDPITNGHIDVIRRAQRIFDEVVVLVAEPEEKNPLFTLSERKMMVEKAVGNIDGIICDSFDGLLVNYLREKKINIVIRGLRAVSDFDYEFQMTLINRKLSPEIEFVFLMPGEEYFFLSSSLVKEIASLGGDISKFVPAIVEKELRKRFASKILD